MFPSTIAKSCEYCYACTLQLLAFLKSKTINHRDHILNTLGDKQLNVQNIIPWLSIKNKQTETLKLQRKVGEYLGFLSHVVSKVMRKTIFPFAQLGKLLVPVLKKLSMAGAIFFYMLSVIDFCLITCWLKITSTVVVFLWTLFQNDWSFSSVDSCLPNNLYYTNAIPYHNPMHYCKHKTVKCSVYYSVTSIIIFYLMCTYWMDTK